MPREEDNMSLNKHNADSMVAMDGYKSHETEVVMRSGAYGKVLKVERESARSMQLSLRGDASHKSQNAHISSCRMSKKSDMIEEEDDKRNIQHANWYNISALMASEVIGAGVLTLAGKYAQLGWVLATVLLILMFFVTFYCSLLMVEVKKVFPAIVCLADGAEYTLGKVGKHFVNVFFLTKMTLTLGDYLLIAGKSLGGALYEFHICLPVWMVCVFIVLGPLSQLRTLNAATTLCYLNMTALLAAIFIVIAQLVMNGRGPEVQTHVIAEDLTFNSVMQSMSSIYFAYGGSYIYYELMAEMKDFTDFPKAFIIAGPFQVGVYLLVGIVGYYYKGQDAAGYYLDNLGFGPMFRAASALIFYHMIMSCFIYTHVISKIMHVYIWPQHVNKLGWKGTLEWAGVTLSVMGVAYVLANAVPFFEALTSLIGGFFNPTLCVILPVIYYIRTCFLVRRKIPIWKWAILIFLLALSALVTVTSTIQNVTKIVKNWETYGAPFECHCEAIWDTCECSDFRMEIGTNAEVCVVNGTSSG